jgi:cholesterol transport system auxiliary component
MGIDGMTQIRAILTVAAALALTGCVNLGGEEAPPFLLTLSPDAAPATGAPRTNAEAKTLTVLIPTAPQKLRTQRIPVQKDDGSVAYIVEAQWVEAPQRLFQRLLSDTISAGTDRLVLDEGQYLTAPGEQLAGQLLEFGIDARSNEAVVTYQAMIVSGGGKNVRQQRFEAREDVSAVEARSAGAALSRAANKVAGDVAKWVAG